MKWATKIPKEVGLYWFIGEPFITKDNNNSNNLYIVKIEKWELNIFSNEYNYRVGGRTMSNLKGLWQKVKLPKMPEGFVAIVK